MFLYCASLHFSSLAASICPLLLGSEAFCVILQMTLGRVNASVNVGIHSNAVKENEQIVEVTRMVRIVSLQSFLLKELSRSASGHFGAM